MKFRSSCADAGISFDNLSFFGGESAGDKAIIQSAGIRWAKHGKASNTPETLPTQ